MSREFIIPNKIITGEDALPSARPYFQKMGKKALIVTGKHVIKLDCFTALTNTLEKAGITHTVFSGITGEPDDKMVEEGLSAYRAGGCDFLIGIGGGSPLDSMKAIAALERNPGKLSDYMGKSIEGPLPPMAAIPTTAGTGSEATQFSVITDSEKGVKMLLKGEALIPDLAILQPEFTETSPKSITASTGLDALTHAIESYTSKKRQPLSNGVALSAVRRIFKYLPRAYRDGANLKAREEMAIAALEAGMAINNASVTLVHGLSRPIGALFHVPHGVSNAMLLKSCISFALDGAYELFGDLGRAIGAAPIEADDKTAAWALVEGLEELCRICEIPSLAEYGVDKEKFFEAIDKMVNDAADSGSLDNTIKAVTKEDAARIYKSLW